MKRPDGPADFAGRLEHSIAVAVMGGKVVSYAHLLANYVSSRRRIPKSRLAGAIVALAGVESAAGVVRTLRSGRVVDRAVGWADAAMAVVSIVGEAVTWGTRAFPPDPRLGLPHALTLGVFLPAMLPQRRDVLRAVAAPTVAFVVASSPRAVGDPAPTRRALRLSEACVLPVSTLLSHRLADELRRLAAERDAAETAAILTAARLAAERERQRQLRSIHDSPLQFLEAVGGAWDIDERTLLDRIELEIDGLTQLGAAGPAAADGLHDGLGHLAARFADLGLAVVVVVPDPTTMPRLGPTAIDAALGGVHEALINVVKHAQAGQATVTVTVGADRTEIVVRDRGVGFDPADRLPGLGIHESIVRRMEEVGGGGTVAAAPGQGTEVRLWVTSGSQSS